MGPGMRGELCAIMCRAVEDGVVPAEVYEAARNWRVNSVTASFEKGEIVVYCLSKCNLSTCQGPMGVYNHLHQASHICGAHEESHLILS